MPENSVEIVIVKRVFEVEYCKNIEGTLHTNTA